jgi:hypothetical protein
MPQQGAGIAHWICTILARQMTESREKWEEVNGQWGGMNLTNTLMVWNPNYGRIGTREKPTQITLVPKGERKRVTCGWQSTCQLGSSTKENTQWHIRTHKPLFVPLTRPTWKCNGVIAFSLLSWRLLRPWVILSWPGRSLVCRLWNLSILSHGWDWAECLSVEAVLPDIGIAQSDLAVPTELVGIHISRSRTEWSRKKRRRIRERKRRT